VACPRDATLAGASSSGTSPRDKGDASPLSRAGSSMSRAGSNSAGVSPIGRAPSYGEQQHSKSMAANILMKVSALGFRVTV